MKKRFDKIWAVLFLVLSGIMHTAAQDFNMIGFAAVNAEGMSTTTGGQGGSVINISSLSQLQDWGASREKNTSPEIVNISGTISASSSTVITIKNGANISIIGTGNNAELVNVGLNIRDYDNVIVRNLKIREVLYPNDGITLDGVNHAWVDHCELHSKIGDGIGVDTYDGLLDIKNGSRYITVSWNYFHDHMKCNLVGHTNSTSQQELDSQIKVTYHHNWFARTNGRNPSLRFGAAHMFNNYFEDIDDYGIAARVGAHAKMENNHYHNVKLPMSTDKFPVDGLPNGYICETGNIFSGTSGGNVISQDGCNYWNSSTLPYSYSLDAVNTVEGITKLYTGVGKLEGGTDAFILNVQSGENGTVSLNPGGGVYASGTEVTITAEPDFGYEFVGWSGDASGNAISVTITMDSEKNITANFQEYSGPTYELTLETLGGGDVSVNPEQGPYPAGTEVILTAVPKLGFEFSSWSGASAGSANPLTLTMDSDLDIKAEFVEKNSDSWTTIEAESAKWASGKAAVEEEYTGFSGSGYVNTENESGVYIEFELDAAQLGEYQVNVYYALGVEGNRPMGIVVNGEELFEMDGNSTSDWSQWTPVNFTISLDEGKNNFRIVGSASEGLPNIDKIEVKQGASLRHQTKKTPKFLSVTQLNGIDQVRVDLPTNNLRDMKLGVFDVFGNRLNSFSLSDNDMSVLIPTKGFIAGMYILVLQSEKQVFYKKFLIK